MHDSYRDAAPALRAGSRLEPVGRVFTVTDLRVPQLAASVVRRETLITWAECGYPFVRTAERLVVHRDTLLHRLTTTGDR
ncbi:hypothetical protein AB5J55_34515 [Streptomyces sp. R11]|uniref:PucR C-terminal helix-turn-helix domain-containing protein n=1 Tax=Streptomyces sp. R11 TaxID=3238625 RepID=A0AB39NB54_9ACTN